MPVLSKAEILGAIDLPIERVPCPEWGGEVILKTMSGTERDAFEAQSLGLREAGRTLDNFRARLVAWSAVDEAGNLLFTAEDVQALGRKSASVLDRLFDVAQRLSALRKEDVVELTKNSETGPGAGSSFDLPSLSEKR